MSNVENKKNKIHILLVDDAKVNLLMGRKMLEQLECDVIVAENGLEAIEALKNCDTKFNLILMDLEMPQLGGLQAATEIREQQLTYAPIYALTAHNSKEIRFLCKAARMNGFLTKPLNLEKLKEIVERVK